MKRLLLLLSAALALMLTSPCHARLGETVDESIQRYGKPVMRLDGVKDCVSVKFRVRNIEIFASFYKGLCVGLVYRKGQPGSNQPDAFTREEVQVLLAQNSEGQAWNLPGDGSLLPPGQQIINRADGASAGWNGGDLVELATPGFLKYVAVLKASKVTQQQLDAQQAMLGL